MRVGASNGITPLIKANHGGGVSGNQKTLLDTPLSFRAQHFQKSKKFHQLQRKWFNFKPLTPTHPPTHPGEAVLGDTGRGREEEDRNKEAGKEEGGWREERGRSEGGGEAGARTKVRVRELEGRKLSGGRKGGGREGM